MDSHERVGTFFFFFSNIAFLIIEDSLSNKNGYWQILSLYGDKTTLIGNVMSFKQSFPLILLKNMNVLYEQHSVEYSFILTRNLLAAHVLLKIRGILLWNRNVRPLKLPVKIRYILLSLPSFGI